MRFSTKAFVWGCRDFSPKSKICDKHPRTHPLIYVFSRNTPVCLYTSIIRQPRHAVTGSLWASTAAKSAAHTAVPAAVGSRAKVLQRISALMRVTAVRHQSLVPRCTVSMVLTKHPACLGSQVCRTVRASRFVRFETIVYPPCDLT